MVVDETKSQVDKALDVSSDPVPEKTSEEVASPEVKVDQEPAKEPEKEPQVDTSKLQEQVNNLNTALKEARAESKGKVDQSRVEELEAKLAEREGFITRLQTAFEPEKAAEEQAPKYLTAEEAENMFKERLDEEKNNTFKEKQAEKIKGEITELEKAWDGANGKPKYEDDKVLKWQQENSKLYLSPVEAFSEMAKSDIIDWEVKQRLAGKKPVENVEKPGVSPDVHTPAETKPQTDQELRSAIAEAINSADAEL